MKKQTPTKPRKESLSDSKVDDRTSTEDSTKGDKYSEHSFKVAKSSELSSASKSSNGASVSASKNQEHSISEHSDKSLRKSVSENTGGQNVESKDITPQKAEGQIGSATTPGKPKSKRRLAANFNFGNATP